MRMYYVALQRYHAEYGKSPYTMFAVKNEDLVIALNEFISIWRNRIAPSTDATEQFLKVGMK